MSSPYKMFIQGEKEVAAVLAAKELHTLESIDDNTFEAILNAVLVATGYAPVEEAAEEETQGEG